nr:MAG: DnaB-like helicase C terminal domain [Bacteriophage sp.]
MNRYIDKPDVASFLQRAKKNIAGKPSYICPSPVCRNGSGKDGTGIVEDPDRPGHYHCFKCGFDGDAFDLLDIVKGKPKGYSYKEAEKMAGGTSLVPFKKERTEMMQKTYRTYEQYINACASALPGSLGEKYLQDRGLTADIISKYKIGYDNTKRTIVIPYPGTGYYISRSLEGKRYLKPPAEEAGAEPIFNAEHLNGGTTFIMESQLDALSIIQAGGKAVAIGGGGERKLLDYKGQLPNMAYIVADNDEAGEATARRIKAALKGLKVRAMIVHPPKAYKDANDLLRGDIGLLRHLVTGDNWRAWEYAERESAAAYIKSFWDDAKTKTEPTETGFSRLDSALGGGIYEGLYIMGAVSSLGKTTFCLQMADQIAQEKDVIIFSLEMARSELIAKSLSRLSLELCGGDTRNAKTTRAITDPKQSSAFSLIERELMNRATAQYKSFARRLWISEGLGTIGTKQIGEAIKKHIAITGNVPFVLIDYLQILASPDPRMSDKQATDKNVFELKRISREYKCPILAISSFNRDNYTAALNMTAFKESGAIEYSSDVLLGLQPQGMTDKGTESAKAENARTLDTCKKADTRQLELKILKNRHGKTGSVINYQYTPMFNYFKELDG